MKKATSATGYPVTDQHGSGLLVAEADRNGRERKIYASLARLPLPRSYLGKIMLCVFLALTSLS